MHAYLEAPKFNEKILTLNVGEYQLTRKYYDEIAGVFPDLITWRIHTMVYGIMYVRKEGNRWVETLKPND